MTKLDRLIAELCPDGVEYKKLCEITTVARGVRVTKSQLAESGHYPVYQNSMIPLGYYDKRNCQACMVFVISAGAAGEVGYSTVDFWAADDCFYFVQNEHFHSRFLYHALRCQQKRLYSRDKLLIFPGKHPIA